MDMLQRLISCRIIIIIIMYMCIHVSVCVYTVSHEKNMPLDIRS